MLHYNVRYFSRFPGDPMAQDHAGVRRSLHWITDDLFHLSQVLGPPRTTKLQDAIERARRHLIVNTVPGNDILDLNANGLCAV